MTVNQCFSLFSPDFGYLCLNVLIDKQIIYLSTQKTKRKINKDIQVFQSEKLTISRFVFLPK